MTGPTQSRATGRAGERQTEHSIDLYDRNQQNPASVCSPLGWRKDAIGTYLSASQDVSLAAFHDWRVGWLRCV